MEENKRLRELGVDIANGIIPLIGTVDDEMHKRLIDCLIEMNNLELKYEVLTIVLNTYGGELYHAFAIYDLLKRQEMDIRIVCNGPVMSAGTIILMAGDIREITPLSFLMVHYGFDMQDSHSGLKQNANLLDLMKRLYKENSKASSKVIDTWFDADKYFTAQQALQIGLVDRIQKYAKPKSRQKSAKKS